MGLALIRGLEVAYVRAAELDVLAVFLVVVGDPRSVARHEDLHGRDLHARYVAYRGILRVLEVCPGSGQVAGHEGSPVRGEDDAHHVGDAGVIRVVDDAELDIGILRSHLSRGVS